MSTSKSVHPHAQSLSVFIDLGSSLVKVFYYNNSYKVLLVPPNLVTASEKRLRALIDANPSAAPEDLTWLERDQELIAVGKMAENLQANATSTIKQRKMEQGLYRVLAILGILQETLELPEEFECDLGVALPVAEYADREMFAESLRDEASNFICRGQTLKASFGLLDVHIEGIGLVRDRRAELIGQGKPAKALKIVALMFGHRNLSVLTFASTLQLESSSSSGPGFIKAVETVARALAVEPTTEGLTEIVALKKTSYRFDGAARARDTTEAVAEAIDEYWDLVSDHLSSHLPSGEFDVVCAGGASGVIQDRLQKFFSEVGLGDRLSFADGLKDKLIQELSNDPVLSNELAADSFLPLRLLDAFVGIQTLILKAGRASATPVTESKPKVVIPKNDSAIVEDASAPPVATKRKGPALPSLGKSGAKI